MVGSKRLLAKLKRRTALVNLNRSPHQRGERNPLSSETINISENVEIYFASKQFYANNTAMQKSVTRIWGPNYAQIYFCIIRWSFLFNLNSFRFCCVDLFWFTKQKPNCSAIFCWFDIINRQWICLFLSHIHTYELYSYNAECKPAVSLFFSASVNIVHTLKSKQSTKSMQIYFLHIGTIHLLVRRESKYVFSVDCDKKNGDNVQSLARFIVLNILHKTISMIQQLLNF